jgi:hypothetical protein
MTGVQADTLAKYKLVAQMKQCSEATGTLISGTTFKFSGQLLRQDVVCTIRLIGPKAAEANVVFFDALEDGLYFEDSNVVIKEDQSGGLVANAFLEKRFTEALGPTTRTWRITAPIESSAPLENSCTCRIECSPEIINDASLVKVLAEKDKGTCTFDNAVDPELESTECSEMIVQCGEGLFVGKWLSPQKADTKSGGSEVFPTLKILPAVSTDEGDVIVIPEIKKKDATLR